MLLLITSETTPQAMIGEDFSITAARSNFGLQKMEEIKYAVLEKDGSISIIPFEGSAR